jgi:hypothetical protein
MRRICGVHGLEQAVPIGLPPRSCPCDAAQRFATAKMTKVASLAKPQTADSWCVLMHLSEPLRRDNISLFMTTIGYWVERPYKPLAPPRK